MADMELHLGDCLEIMPKLADKSVNAIICDLPYGTTACAWDSVIPFEPLWAQYKRIIKPRGAIVLFGSQPFTSALVMSNLEWFKYEWVWKKAKPNGWQHAKNKPMKANEDILIFSPAPMGHESMLGSKRMTYNPQGVKSCGKNVVSAVFHGRTMGARPNQVGKVYDAFTGYPSNILEYENIIGNMAIHPTQKPVALLQYLIKTYTNPGDTILDNCFGSCSTGVACLNTARNFIGIEKDPEFFRVGKERMEEREKELIELGVIPLSYDKIGKDISNYPARSLFEYQQILEMGGYDEQK